MLLQQLEERNEVDRLVQEAISADILGEPPRIQGAVTYESQPGVGTTLRVELPVADTGAEPS